MSVTNQTMIDSHCHLADLRIFGNSDEHVSNSRKAGIEFLIQAGVDPADWQRQVELHNKHGSIIQIVAGLHPYTVSRLDKASIRLALTKLESFCVAHTVCAIGEIGLDYREQYTATQSIKSLQADATLIQVQYSNQIQKPCVFHVVRAHDEALRLIQLCPPKAGGMIHAFNSNWSVAKRYLDLGLHLSVGTAVLKPQSPLLEVVKKIPLDRLLIESDAPDQAPFDTKNEINTSQSIIRIAQACATALDRDIRTFCSQTSLNARQLFRLEGLDRTPRFVVNS